MAESERPVTVDHDYEWNGKRPGMCGDWICVRCGAERLNVEDRIDPRECGSRDATLAHRKRVLSELAERGADMLSEPATGGQSRLQHEHAAARPTTGAAAAYAALTDRVEVALDVLRRHGQTDGAEHKAWVLDQVARALLGQGYEQWVADFKDGHEGPETYPYDVGVEP